MQGTGLAAMISVYGPKGAAETMIAKVVARHAQVRGVTASGEPYAANDPALLAWVLATTGHGFGGAYSRYVRRLSGEQIDQFYAESAPAARLYGLSDPPTSRTQVDALFEAMKDRLEP